MSLGVLVQVINAWHKRCPHNVVISAMKTYSFWIAIALSGGVHGLAYGAFFVLWLLHAPPSSPPIALVAYGDGGMEVGAVAYGTDNTPGNSELVTPSVSEAPPPPAIEIPQVPPDEVVAVNSDADIALALLSQPTPNTEQPARPATASQTKQTGTGSGSGSPRGTSSMGGGGGGSRSGLRMLGLAKPVYPREAIIKGIEGTVTLFLRISADGKVTEVKIHESSGHEVLDKAALTHARNMLFIPARENYQAVAATALYPMKYSLTDR
jgi:protein TonB